MKDQHIVMTPSPAPQWEYVVRHYGLTQLQDDQAIQAHLDDFGKVGWELVNVVANREDCVTLFLKRRLK